MSSPSLTVELLGGFKLSYLQQTDHADKKADTKADTKDRVLHAQTPDVGSGRQQVLFAYLLLNRHTDQSRAYIAFQLWPDSSEKQARRNLRKVLHRLRQSFPEFDYFWRVDNHRIQWRTSASCTLDVAQFEQQVDEATKYPNDGSRQRISLERAVALYRGDLLPQCYDDWIVPKREQLRQLYHEALTQLTRLAEKQGDYTVAIRHAQQMLRHDPLHEATYGQLMRLHAQAGDRVTSLQLYQTCTTLLERELGVEPGEETRRIYAQILAQKSVAPNRKQPAPQSKAALPLVGRQDEWKTLRASWSQAQQQHIHFCVISGDAGIGKTRLAEELLGWADEQDIATAVSHLYTAAGTLVYTPVIEWLQNPLLQPALDGLDPVWLTELARLMPELRISHPDLPAPLPLPTSQSEQWQRQRLFEAMSKALLVDHRPKLLLIDDIQWSDRETLAWFGYLSRFVQREVAVARHTPSILIVGTARSEELDDAHPLHPLLLELRSANHLTEIALTPLDPDETAALATQVADAPLAVDQTEMLFQQSEGNPLFVVEMVRSGWMERANGPVPNAVHGDDARSLPPKVQAVIQQRLRQLSPAAQQTMALAATIGRSFTFALLQEASDSGEAQVAENLDELWRRGVVRGQEIHTYDFSHDRIREVAYAELSPIQRPRLHDRIARALESVYADGLDRVSAQIAIHYEEAGNAERAIDYYQRAADAAMARFSASDAVVFLKRALTLHESFPHNLSNKRKKLALLTQFAQAVGRAQGFLAPELLSTAKRARELAIDVGDQKNLYYALMDLQIAHQLRGLFEEAQQFSEETVMLAEGFRDGPSPDAPSPDDDKEEQSMLVDSHQRLAMLLWLRGDLMTAQHHFEQAFYAEQQSDEVYANVFSALNTWMLGYPVRARMQMYLARQKVRAQFYPYALASITGNLARLHYFMGNYKRIYMWAKQTISTCETYDFPFWLTIGKIFAARGLGEMGYLDQGIAQMKASLAHHQAQGHKAYRTHYVCMLAELYVQAERLPQALTTVDEALALAADIGEGYWLPEMLRLRGNILLAQGEDPEQATALYQQAIAIAREQRSRTLELRTTVSLCQVWQQQGRTVEAQQTLAPIYNWFTEGFRTPDLRRARQMLVNPGRNK